MADLSGLTVEEYLERDPYTNYVDLADPSNSDLTLHQLMSEDCESLFELVTPSDQEKAKSDRSFGDGDSE